MPQWFKPIMIILAGMLLLLLADAPLGPSQTWRNSLADPMTLRLFGAVIMGVGVYWGIISHAPVKRKRR